MYTTKQALAVKEALPGVETVVFYQDLRGIGKGYEAFLQSARESGVIYIHGLPSSVRKAPGSHDLMVQFTSDDGRPALQEFDMVVLATGLEPGASGSALARLFGVKQNRFGFVETDPLLPTDTSINGIYTAGTITGPKDISESVAQGSAAAVRAMVLLSGQPRALVIKDLPSPERIVETREPQVGVFVCHCGRNIAGAVSIDEVVRQTGHLPEVAFIEDYQYVCSAEGQERIQRKIADLGLNRVVIAACSPAIHEGHFRDTLRKAGLNPYFLEIANIRDQCAWVHPQNRAAATSKATDLVRMAVARSRKAEPVSAIRLAVVPRALVIGGGLAGLTAAFEMASLGLEVAILERGDHLGGNMMRLQYLLNHEDPQVFVDNLIERVAIHPLIHVYTSAALEKISGSVGRFLSSVRQNGRVIEIEHGVVVVATGGIEHSPTGHLLGSHPGVLTQLDLESRLAAGDFKVETIVMLQCVGSRRPGRPYCSRVCCTQAVKNALRLKELHPSLPIVIAHRDIRTYGMDEEAYLQARRKGIRFIRLVDESKPIIEPNLHSGGLSITVHDSSLRGWLRLETSHLVLSTGIEPNPGNRDLSQMLGVPLNSDAFFLEAHAKLRPVETQAEGIFLCGLAHSPQTAGETIVQARAAVARAATILCQPYLEKENIVAEVADELCDGCGYCIEPCPYQAITLSEQTRDGLVKKIVTVDQTKCLGCGICQAVCPKRGINVRNFRPDQLTAMVDAALATRVSGPTS
jgi:heterodisulfide reductase subunit A